MKSAAGEEGSGSEVWNWGRQALVSRRGRMAGMTDSGGADEVGIPSWEGEAPTHSEVRPSTTRDPRAGSTVMWAQSGSR